MTEVKRTYYESGELCQEYFEVDGKKEGIYKLYYQSGNIKEIVPYINGLQHGEIKWYWDNGKIDTEFFMENGKYHGEHKQYDENGNLNNWWTDRDREIYKRKIKDVVEQYEFVNARDGLEYDASIAIGENIADIVGLSLVEEYLFLFQEINKDTNNIKKISLEAFYTYVAIQSRQEVASKALSSQLKTNPHPLEKYRCNCPLSRLDIFRKIYNIQKGDGMWWRNTDTIW